MFKQKSGFGDYFARPQCVWQGEARVIENCRDHSGDREIAGPAKNLLILSLHSACRQLIKAPDMVVGGGVLSGDIPLGISVSPCFR